MLEFQVLVVLHLLIFFPSLTKGKDTSCIFQPRTYSIALVKQRWHTGIVGDTALLRCLASVLPDIPPDAQGVDIGWGDSVFYQLPNFHLGAALSALFLPTPAVLRIAFISFPLHTYLALQERVAIIPLDSIQFHRLCQFLQSQFRKQQPIQNARTVRFYPAAGTYSILKTCNTWIAEAFVAAGILPSAFGIATVDALFGMICRRYQCYHQR